MSLRTALLPVVNTLRGLAGPSTLDIRPYTVTVRTRRWSGGVVQKGTPTDSDMVLAPPPKVVERAREALVGPITPKHPDGGYSPAELNPADQAGVECFYVLVGPDNVRRPFTLVDIDTSRPFTYTLRLMALDRKVPF
jgi:hypothetical protein